jgi:uncharacterized protein (TIGR04551 family)
MVARWVFVLATLITSSLFAQETPSAAQPSLTPPQQTTGEIKLEDWNKEDWMLVKPKLSLFEMDGYFRMRAFMFRRFDFDNQSQTELTPRYPLTDGKNGKGHANFSTANLRLRLEPTINVAEQIQIRGTLDVLDNLSLGSTANTIPPTNGAPLNVLSNSQNNPQNGVNSVSEAILIRRLYARVTALNEQLEFRFGRMPDHWGLGMMANSGDCIDCDFGHSVDRVVGTFKAANLLFQPMFDWVYTGPAALPFGSGSGIDQVVWDDTVQYGLRILRQDHPDEIQDRITHGDTVINFGVWNALRTQSRDLKSTYFQPAGGTAPTATTTVPNGPGNDERRDALIYKGDGYIQIYHEQYELGLEGAIIAGKFRDSYVGNTLQTTSVLQYGGAFEAVAKPRSLQSLRLSFRSGIASGDSAPGYGALDRAYTQRDGAAASTTGRQDRTLNNFNFSPDYHLDLLMFRRIVGTVTDAWYVRPEVSYLFDKKVLGRLWLVYSQAMYRNSTASCMPQAVGGTLSCGGNNHGSRPMGLEIDAEVAYGVGFWDRILNHGLKAAVDFGMLFPFGAFRNNTDIDTNTNLGASPHFAWTIQGRVYLTF